jgi:hypothetical protein
MRCSSGVSITLVIAKRCYWFGLRHEVRLDADCDKRAQQSQRGGCKEQRRLEIDVVSETMQPAVHEEPSNGSSDGISPDHGLDELPYQKPYDIAGARAHGLANANLLRPALGGRSR